jgi:hypothetical protein
MGYNSDDSKKKFNDSRYTCRRIWLEPTKAAKFNEEEKNSKKKKIEHTNMVETEGKLDERVF